MIEDYVPGLFQRLSFATSMKGSAIGYRFIPSSFTGPLATVLGRFNILLYGHDNVLIAHLNRILIPEIWHNTNIDNYYIIIVALHTFP